MSLIAGRSWSPGVTDSWTSSTSSKNGANAAGAAGRLR